ncbi:MAG: ABC transporter permease subunit [Candidatus Thorarchaeota archaeon]
MSLRGTLVKRILQAVVTIFIALSIDFVFFHMLPGDPTTLLSRNPNVNTDIIISQFGLDQPLHIQYWKFLTNFLTGNFGQSFHYHEFNMLDIIMGRLGNTLILILPGSIISILVGIWIGKKSAWKRGERMDIAGLFVALITYSIPSFWLSMFFIMLLAVNIPLFPLTPWVPIIASSNPLIAMLELVQHLILPWCVLTIALIGVFALIMRNALLDVLSEDYMVTARAKGRSEDDQLNKEAAPNAMIPVTTVIALNLGASVTGALQVETVFSYPGIGRLLWDGVIARDYPLLQATFFIITVVIIVANLLADFIYFYLDPRIRVGAEFTITEDKKRFEGFLEFERFYLIVLLIIDCIILLFATSYLNYFLAGTVVIFAIFRSKRIWSYLRIRIIGFAPSNLRFLWINHKMKFISKFSLLFLSLNLSVLIPITALNVFGFDWTLSWIFGFFGGAFPPVLSLDPVPLVLMQGLSVIAHPIITQLSIAGLFVAWIISRRKKTTGTVKQFISTPMGVTGSITVGIFVGMALFGELLAPYDPQAQLTGRPLRPPLDEVILPLEQSIMMISGPLMILFGILILIFVILKKKPQMPGDMISALTGAFLVFIGLLFGNASLVRGSVGSLISSVGVLIVGLYFLLKNLLPIIKRETSFPSIGGLKYFKEHFIAISLIIVGFSSFILSIIVVTSINSLAYPGFHLLGTDQIGKDVFSQLIIGVQITLIIGLVATFITMGIGTLIGLVSGYYGGLADSLLMRFTDIFFVIPSLIIMIILGAVLPPSVYTLILIIGIFSWPSTARIVRGQVLSIKERDYIERVRAVGGSDAYIMGRHVLPAVAPLIVANTVLVTAYAILSEIVLDFFGLGDPTMTSWGTMLFQAFQGGAMLGNLWWLVFPPGIMVILLLMGVSMVGYAMDEIANPRLRRR